MLTVVYVPLAGRCGLVDDERTRLVADKSAEIEALVAKIPEPIQRRIAGEGLSLRREHSTVRRPGSFKTSH